VSRHRVWVPPGASANIAGQTIAGGLLYVGQYLRSGVGTIEPALINPVLPVDRRDPDRSGHGLPPTPSYHLVSATDRAAYLDWLTAGRDHVEAPIGFVLLYFSGLERRVLLDLADDPTVRTELPAITAEVGRLRRVYGPVSRSFDATAGAFLQVLELLMAPTQPVASAPAPPIGLSPDRSRVPLALRVALAQFAVSGRPVPPDWARSWAWYHPSLFPSTPQTRCPHEFNTLFALRYRARLPSGLILATVDRLPIRLSYRPVNPGLDPAVTQRPDLPDVLEETSATRELGALVDSVTEALTPYSRWLARNPEGAGSTASTILLPSDLLEHEPGPLRRLVNWSDTRLADQVMAVIDGREFTPFWTTADPAGMSREESESLVVVLGRIGLGTEPDVRFGGVALGPGPVVLFRLDPTAGQTPSPDYSAAVTVLDLAASAILPTSTARLDDVVNLTITALAAEVPLTIGERIRLSARLRWLTATTSRLPTGPAANRLRRKAAGLSASEREAAGHLLLAVAVAVSNGSGGLVGSETVRSLTTAYRMIGLPEELVFQRLHQHDLADGDAPVIVRRARTEAPGHRLPRKSASPPVAPSAAQLEPEDRTDAPIRLRQSVLNRTMAQTGAVSSLLRGILVDDEPAPVAGSAGPGLFAGLDSAHGSLLRQLATRSAWSRADLAELADRHGVLPDGALDVINATALEVTGELVIEGDDELAVNDDVLRVILGDEPNAT
jgi:hypothetical protein